MSVCNNLMKFYMDLTKFYNSSKYHCDFSRVRFSRVSRTLERFEKGVLSINFTTRVTFILVPLPF
jgi:hypothetical protein